MDVQKIICDTELTLQAKAILLYLLTESNGNTEFQMKSPLDIKDDLQIGDFQYYSHLHTLIDKGYIIVQRTRDNKKRFNGNKCIINTEEKYNG